MLWFLGSALTRIAIYLYTCTKFDLNANSSFNVICRTRYRTDRWTDGQSGDYNMLPPLESIILLHNMTWLYVIL